MNKATLLAFMRSNRLAVQTSVGAGEAPQAALVGIAVTDDFEVIFDTLATTRKAQNLRRNPHVALVIGGSAETQVRTLQYEGIADEPEGQELERCKAVYFDAWPSGHEREAWEGIAYIRVRPTWVRYSDFEVDPPLILDFNAEALRALRSD